MEPTLMKIDETGLFTGMEVEDSVTVELFLYKNGLHGAKVILSSDSEMCYHVLLLLLESFAHQVRGHIKELGDEGDEDEVCGDCGAGDNDDD